MLDAHGQKTVRDVLGSVRNAAVDGRRGTALIQFSSRPKAEPVWQVVLEGILRHVSSAARSGTGPKPPGTARVLTAVRWDCRRLISVSYAAMGSAPGAA